MINSANFEPHLDSGPIREFIAIVSFKLIANCQRVSFGVCVQAACVILTVRANYSQCVHVQHFTFTLRVVRELKSYNWRA